MEYPLIIGGERRGTLRRETEGLYTVFEAELKNLHEGMYRIWLWGGGERAYLGLMQPWSGGLYLRRRLSRTELRSFPRNIEYASDEGEPRDANKECLEKPEEETAAACPWPAPTPEKAGELLWFRRCDGSMVSHDGISSLLALPASLRRSVPGTVLREIEGKEYLLFRY